MACLLNFPTLTTAARPNCELRSKCRRTVREELPKRKKKEETICWCLSGPLAMAIITSQDACRIKRNACTRLQRALMCSSLDIGIGDSPPYTSKKTNKTKQATDNNDAMQRPSSSRSWLPSTKVVGVVHRVLIVPTLALTTEQPLSDSSIALGLVLHPCLKDTRVRKIN